MNTTTNSAIAALENALIALISKGEIDLPLLPEVAGRVIQLAQNPDSDAAELAKLIEGDVSLAGHVMRIANSAVYSPNTNIISLQQAITRLGMKLIAEIALAASINSKLFDAPEYEQHIRSILNFSLASGLWAKEVARLSRKNVEAAFISGLLHDIGRPIAIQSLSKIKRELAVEIEQEDLLTLEEKYQRSLGEKTVENWNMPKTIIEVVRYFENYLEPHESQFVTMIAVAGTVIASHIIPATKNCYCMTLEEVKQHPIFADLNIYADEIDQILSKKDNISQTLEAMAS